MVIWYLSGNLYQSPWVIAESIARKNLFKAANLFLNRHYTPSSALELPIAYNVWKIIKSRGPGKVAEQLFPVYSIYLWEPYRWFESEFYEEEGYCICSHFPLLDGPSFFFFILSYLTSACCEPTTASPPSSVHHKHRIGNSDHLVLGGKYCLSLIKM